jgi:hypothetical protein
LRSDACEAPGGGSPNADIRIGRIDAFLARDLFAARGETLLKSAIARSGWA